MAVEPENRVVARALERRWNLHKLKWGTNSIAEFCTPIYTPRMGELQRKPVLDEVSC
jgi:hypothetical protein